MPSRAAARWSACARSRAWTFPGRQGSAWASAWSDPHALDGKLPRGICLTIVGTEGGVFTWNMGLAVSITGHDTNGVAVCNQVRSFDIEARVRAGSARFVESIDQATIEEIVARVVSVIDPGP